jgi:hypothetical protein
MAFSDTYSPKRGPYFMEAEPGEYRGAVTVAAGEVTQSLPLVLQVYPLAPTIGQLRKAVQQEYARSDAALVSGLKYVHPQSIDPVDEARAHAVRQHTFRVRTGLIRLFVFAGRRVAAGGQPVCCACRHDHGHCGGNSLHQLPPCHVGTHGWWFSFLKP